MKAEKILDLVVWLFIAAFGLVAAYVCFGILKSESSGRFQQYSLGGAIAGAIISWGVLTSVYLQLRGSSNELEKLQNRTQELQNKLIRGAPRPLGFDTEVDERQRIVLARPTAWQPKGGTIFELEAPEATGKSEDTFPATFRCFFVPIENGKTPARDEFYDESLKEITSIPRYMESYTHEIVQIGGELAGVESLKLIIHQFTRVLIKRSRKPERVERAWSIITKEEFAGRIHSITPAFLHMRQPVTLDIFGSGFRKGAVGYVDSLKRETEVIDDWHARLTLENDDVAFARNLDISLENPNTGGLRTNICMVNVAEAAAMAPASDWAPITNVLPQLKNEEIDSSESHLENSKPPKQPEVDTLPQPIPSEPSNSQQSKPPEPIPPESKSNPDGAVVSDTLIGEVTEQTIYQRILRMRVICYHEALGKIYYFDFLDDVGDFKESSAVFNRILASTRFLD